MVPTFMELFPQIKFLHNINIRAIFAASFIETISVIDTTKLLKEQKNWFQIERNQCSEESVVV